MPRKEAQMIPSNTGRDIQPLDSRIHDGVTSEGVHVDEPAPYGPVIRMVAEPARNVVVRVKFWLQRDKRFPGGEAHAAPIASGQLILQPVVYHLYQPRSHGYWGRGNLASEHAINAPNNYTCDLSAIMDCSSRRAAPTAVASCVPSMSCQTVSVRIIFCKIMLLSIAYQILGHW